MIKHAYLITPNIPEAEVLSNMKINTPEDMIYAGSILINKGATNVLIKGGHLKGSFVRDVLINKKEIKVFKNKKINSKKYSWNRLHIIKRNYNLFSMWKNYKQSMRTWYQIC